MAGRNQHAPRNLGGRPIGIRTAKQLRAESDRMSCWRRALEFDGSLDPALVKVIGRQVDDLLSNLTLIIDHLEKKQA